MSNELGRTYGQRACPLQLGDPLQAGEWAEFQTDMVGPMGRIACHVDFVATLIRVSLLLALLMSAGLLLVLFDTR